MKTLVNKNNPAIKIITDALLSDGDSYITSFCSVPKYNWTLVEEEPKMELEKEIDKFIDGFGLNARKK